MDYSELHEILKERYGDLGWWPAETRDQIIIGAILTQNTTWNNVRLALGSLAKNELDSIKALSNLNVEEIREHIRPAGFFNQKSRYLKDVCSAIEMFGGIEELDKLSDNDLKEFLLSLNGIGTETMQDIMLYAFNRKVFVVDKYTERLFSRIGIIRPGMKEAYRLGREIEESLGIDDLRNFHGEIVEISKDICRAKPRCQSCFIRQMCNYEKDLTEP